MRVKKMCFMWKRSAFSANATFLPEFQSTQSPLSFLTKQNQPERVKGHAESFPSDSSKTLNQ